MPGSKKTYESLQANKTQVIPIGKEQSFDFFFRQYYTALCYFAQSIIHNEEDAKDMVQDCFIKLLDHDNIIKKANSVKSFLYTMVHNRCIDYIRRKGVITKATSYLQNTKDDIEYFDELAFAEMVRQLIHHIDELPGNMSTVLKQYYLQGKKHTEIAAALSTTPNAVKLQKSRAIKLLKQKLLFLISLLFIFF